MNYSEKSLTFFKIRFSVCYSSLTICKTVASGYVNVTQDLNLKGKKKESYLSLRISVFFVLMHCKMRD